MNTRKWLALSAMGLALLGTPAVVQPAYAQWGHGLLDLTYDQRMAFSVDPAECLRLTTIFNTAKPFSPEWKAATNTMGAACAIDAKRLDAWFDNDYVRRLQLYIDANPEQAASYASTMQWAKARAAAATQDMARAGKPHTPWTPPPAGTAPPPMWQQLFGDEMSKR